MNIRKSMLTWHNKMGWWATAAIMIWVVSGISHPLMSWFGPQAKRFFPPVVSVSGDELGQLPEILKYHDGPSPRVVKMVPFEGRELLQVTTDPALPREYYDLESGAHLPGHDIAQAKWLASYYTGLDTHAVSSVEYVNEFSNEYPAVNRLLPVYKIAMSVDISRGARLSDTPANGTIEQDDVVVFIHTETLALASISNDFKRIIQNIFQQLHTFKWLESLEYGRVILVALFMLTLGAFSMTGLALVLFLKNRKIQDPNRRFHRWFAYALWLPLLAWSVSGFYHLLQMSFVTPLPRFALGGDKLDVSRFASMNRQVLAPLTGHQVNHLSLLLWEDEQPMIRASVSPLKALNEGKPINRNARFSGRPSETQALYLDVNNGGVMNISDKDLVIAVVQRRLGTSAEDIRNVELVTRFGPDYDFRNKRLPVWKVTTGQANGKIVFIDAATGIIVDQTRTIDRAERWSFSFLHKWNYLTPFMGRFVRDILIVITLLCILATSIMGVVLLLNKNKRVRGVRLGTHKSRLLTR